MNDLTKELEQILLDQIDGEVRFDPYSKVLYSTDASLYQIEPIGVVVPKHKADVIAAIKIAYERNVPILPRVEAERASQARLWGKQSSSTCPNT